MRNSWNLAKRSRIWGLWLAALTLLLLCSAACTAVIDGQAPGDGLSGNTGNQLICQPGQTACNGACVDLQSASNNCG